MALTIQAIAADCDAHILYPDSGRTAEQTAYLVNSINKAIEEMRVLCPQVFRKTYDVEWTGGAAQSVSLTNGSKAWSGTGAPGSSVSIGGDLSFNELDSATSLLFPFTGGTGSQSALVYGDSVVLDGTVGQVLGCALLTERRPLGVLNSRAEWMEAQGLPRWHDYNTGTIDIPARRQPGTPRFIWIETVLNSAGVLETRARCAPLPSGTFRATLDVETMVADVTAADLASDAATITGTLSPDLTGNYPLAGLDEQGSAVFFKSGSPPRMLSYDGANWQLFTYDGALVSLLWTLASASKTDPSGTYTLVSADSGAAVVTIGSPATTRPVPGARVYGILRSLALYHWSGSAWFRNDAVRPIITAGYQSAIAQLQGFQKNRAEICRSAIVYYG